MEITLPLASEQGGPWSENDFDTYKIPHPTEGTGRGEGDCLVLKFKNPEDAIKYAIHLNDVYVRMEGESDYECSRNKISEIIKSINEQVTL